MNQLTNPELTMTSLQIAELVESRHANVYRTIERLMDAGVIQGGTPTEYTHPQNGQQYRQYNVNQRDSYIIVAQLSPEFTARLVDRWQELEAAQQQQFRIPQTYMEALEAHLSAMRDVAALEEQRKVEAPKVAFAEKVEITENTKLITDYAKTVGLGPNKLMKILREQGVLLLDEKRNAPKQVYLDRGLFEVKVWIQETEYSMCHIYTPSVTGRGQVWLHKKLSEWGVI